MMVSISLAGQPLLARQTRYLCGLLCPSELQAEILSGVRHKNILGFYGAVTEPPHNLYFVLGEF